MVPPFFQTEIGDGPLVACAVHAGHAVCPEVEELLLLDAAQRRYEEDPYTDEWASIAPTRLVGCRSRFEVDLNRPRDTAVYRRPEDAWGLNLWKSPPPAELVARSLSGYDGFYKELRRVLDQLVSRHGLVVVFDLHSYNHCRHGLDRPADPTENPEINVGTGSMDRARWQRIVERILIELRGCDFLGRRLDVRENVRFRGGHLPTWIHANYPQSVCAPAIEAKKFFMNEWTGELDRTKFDALQQALAQAAAATLDELKTM